MVRRRGLPRPSAAAAAGDEEVDGAVGVSGAAGEEEVDGAVGVNGAADDSSAALGDACAADDSGAADANMISFEAGGM